VGYLPIEEKVVCSWWDYGYWLTMLGNVTSLADNATINGTQIENVGFTFMANETQAVEMLKRYNAKYILVFTTLAVGQQNNQYYASWAGYGDEGKWMWMARISGKAKDRFIQEGILDERSAWTNETTFGNYTNNKWAWNDVGTNSTIYKLMLYGKQRWCTVNNAVAVNEQGQAESSVELLYFKEAYIAGLNLSPSDAQSKYGNLVPLVCLYEIKYPD
jgi:asparagine N-glycosylation enzyme membrane subunit Stt3